MEIMCNAEVCISYYYGIPVIVWLLVASIPLCWGVTKVVDKK